MGNSYVKVFNKLWAEMALADSFYPTFWSTATFLSRQIWPLCFFLSVRHLFSFFLLFYLLPSAYWDCWIGCCGSTCPRLLSGTNFKKPAWKKKRWKGKYGGERARGEEERGSSSTTDYPGRIIFSVLGLEVSHSASDLKVETQRLERL